MTSRPLTALMAAAAIASPGAAQVSVHVVDGSGSPIPAVRIDMLGGGELLGTTSTNADGTAELGIERWAEVRRLTLTHLAFGTTIVQVEDIPADGSIRLEPQATEIEGLSVAAPKLCPIDDEDRARRLWSDVAGRYATDTGSRAWFARLSRYGGPVREQELHHIPDSEFVNHLAAGGPGVIHGGDHTPRPLEERVRKEGYAWPPLVVGGTTGRRDLAWTYPELDREHAHHFASPVFGALHDFAVAHETEGETTLVFCANEEGRGATMRGIITLVPAEAFVRAEWRFEAPDQDEHAGGSVTFASYVEGADVPPHLVASRGLFFRHTGAARPYPDLPMTYARFGTARIRWFLLPSAARPCNTGLSFHGDPPGTPEAARFTECVARYWPGG